MRFTASNGIVLKLLHSFSPVLGMAASGRWLQDDESSAQIGNTLGRQNFRFRNF